MAKPVRMLKLDPETHQLIEDVSKWLGMDPAKFVAEAVVYYLDNRRENLVERVQERLNELFNTLDEARAPKPTGWHSNSTPKPDDPWSEAARRVPAGGWGSD